MFRPCGRTKAAQLRFTMSLKVGRAVLWAPTALKQVLRSENGVRGTTHPTLFRFKTAARDLNRETLSLREKSKVKGKASSHRKQTSRLPSDTHHRSRLLAIRSRALTLISALPPKSRTAHC